MLNNNKIDFPSPIDFLGTDEKLPKLVVNGEMKEVIHEPWYRSWVVIGNIRGPLVPRSLTDRAVAFTKRLHKMSTRSV